MSNIRQLSRRDFLKAGGVLVIGVSMVGCGKENSPIATRSLSSEPWSPDVFVSFEADGTVHIISHRSEMGQGIRTGLQFPCRGGTHQAPSPLEAERTTP